MKTANKFILSAFMAMSILATNSVQAQKYTEITNTATVEMLKGECWWGGFNTDGRIMPYTESTDIERNQFGFNDENQIQPLFISSKGRYIWSDAPLKYSINDGVIEIGAYGSPIEVGQVGENVVDAFHFVSHKHFPATGTTPHPLLFKQPQYNTWIELTYNQNEQDILKYADKIIEQGYPTGVLMIDDTWQEDYGDWRFSARRFQDPKSMMDKLHDKGFKLMLWICPFVSADSESYRLLAPQGALLQDPIRATTNGDAYYKSANVRWWNGVSALLDLTKQSAKDWFLGALHSLENEYGVDGFKFDAGDSQFYAEDYIYPNTATPNDHTEAFSEIGLMYPLNEYRASWKMAGQPLAQRLKDKPHTWECVEQLIPDILAQGIMGYAYVCPDMIGGGSWTTFLSGNVDQELVVRSAQVHALMPMMQFSVAPWRVLSESNAEICAEMARLHSKFGERIYELAKESSKSGEPIARYMAFNYPNMGYESIIDQFMLGDDILVAPVVKSGARSRKVVLPKGVWLGDDGSKVRGGKTITIDVPLERLPYYVRIK